MDSESSPEVVFQGPPLRTYSRIPQTQPVRTYSQIPHSLIQVCGGHLNERLSTNVCEEVSEDSNYRVRQLTTTAANLMRHSRRKKLTVSDWKLAMYHCKEDHAHNDGYYNLVKCVLDLEAYAEKEEYYEEEEESYFTGKWLNSVDVIVRKALNKDLKKYYRCVTTAILKGGDNLCTSALNDLKVNGHIRPLIPYFVFFIANAMNKLSHLTSYSSKILLAIDSLVSNPRLYLGHESLLIILVNPVLICIVQENCGYDHWLQRDRAAQLLAKILNGNSGASKELFNKVISYLEDVFKDVSRPFCSHYGALAALIAIDISAITKVITLHMSTYFRHLNNSMKFNSRQDNRTKHDAYMVHGQLLLASELIIRNCLNLNVRISPHKFKCDFTSDLRKLIPALLEYFGDALAVRIPMRPLSHTQVVNLHLSEKVVRYEPTAKDKTLLDKSHKKDSEKISKKRAPKEVKIPPKKPPSRKRSRAIMEDDNLCNLMVKEVHSDPTSGIKLILKRKPKKKSSGHGKSKSPLHSKHKKSKSSSRAKQRKLQKKKKVFTKSKKKSFNRSCGNLMIFL